jgi:hypothetical protein
MRLFVYPSIKARRSIAVIECDKVTKTKATVPSNVNLEGIKPGMIACPGEGRNVDRSTIYVIAEVGKGNLTFESGTPVVVETTPPEDQSP